MLLMATILIAAVPQEACVAIPQGAKVADAEAAGDAWYIGNEPITVGNRTYVKYGLPRVLQKGDVTLLAPYRGAAVYAEARNPQREVLYVLTNLAGCEFQPYQVRQ